MHAGSHHVHRECLWRRLLTEFMTDVAIGAGMVLLVEGDASSHVQDPASAAPAQSPQCSMRALDDVSTSVDTQNRPLMDS
jgi:hypothetical protein